MLQSLHAGGPTTRAALSRELGLTRAAMTDLAGRLIDAGWLLQDADASRAGLGRPGQLLRLRSESAYFIGAEIGVERLVVAVVDLAGSVLARGEERGDLKGVAPTEVFDRLARLIGATRRRSRAPGVGGGLGVSVPGFMRRGGVVISAPLLGWREIDVVAALRERFDGPVIAENDANATAHGEWHFASAAARRRSRRHRACERRRLRRDRRRPAPERRAWRRG